jgi:hypothetical protein
MGGSVDRPRVIVAGCAWPPFSSEMVQVASGELRLRSTEAAAMVGELGVGGTAAAAVAGETELGGMGEVAGLARVGEIELGCAAATTMAGETGFRGMGAAAVVSEIEGTEAAAAVFEERTSELWEWLVRVVPEVSTS